MSPILATRVSFYAGCAIFGEKARTLISPIPVLP